jgi:hypothetical protein
MAQATDANANKRKFCDPTKLLPGDFVSRTSYLKVIATEDISVVFENEFGKQIKVPNKTLRRTSYATRQHEESVEVDRAEIIRILRNDIRDKVFSVSIKNETVGEVVVLTAVLEGLSEKWRMRARDLTYKTTFFIDIQTVKWLCFGNTRYMVSNEVSDDVVDDACGDDDALFQDIFDKLYEVGNPRDKKTWVSATVVNGQFKGVSTRLMKKKMAKCGVEWGRHQYKGQQTGWFKGLVLKK